MCVQVKERMCAVGAPLRNGAQGGGGEQVHPCFAKGGDGIDATHPRHITKPRSVATRPRKQDKRGDHRVTVLERTWVKQAQRKSSLQEKRSCHLSSTPAMRRTLINCEARTLTNYDASTKSPRSTPRHGNMSQILSRILTPFPLSILWSSRGP